ncbi:hypothetical protein HPB47_002347 [Ixodes persulcatus]|uniref:Uncharacterized protein n=1 Tax=Ixodes persulcatus TaxID=34615 RepID=A0AC60PMD7_IXOPE|nr:hypothetical protein HPB47_002347 [Ixodes persulcatus]
MQGQLGLKRTWLLLRHLLDPTSSKHEQQHRLNKFLHQWPGTEDELLQELQSRYIGLPLQRAELDKVNALIRKTYKAALSLSPSTSTDRLLKLGVHNTAEELAEAHLTAQYERLSTTQAGRHILTSL